MLTEREIDAAIAHVAAQLNSTFARGGKTPASKPVALLGILQGGYYFMGKLTPLLQFPYMVRFVGASSFGHGQQAGSVSVELGSGLEKWLEDAETVVLIDELFDRGHTLRSVAEGVAALRKVHVSTVQSATLLTKASGTEIPPPTYVGIADVPNVWLVGCGLDDAGTKRGWPMVYACPKVPGIPETDDDQVFVRPDVRITQRRFLLNQIRQFRP
jgi:hypoxanthine phosphoribosyltransferase